MFNAKRHAFVQTIGWVLIYPYSPVMQEGNDKVKLSRRRCYIQLQKGWGNEHVFPIIKSPDHYQKKDFLAVSGNQKTANVEQHMLEHYLLR